MKHSNLSKADIEPLVWVENNENGVVLKSRFLVKLQSAAHTKVTIEETFIKKVHVSKHIAFHYTDNGRNQTISKAQHKADRDADHFH